MGCDIHAYVEYRRPGDGHWSDFGGRMNPGRCYDIFAKLAGVRGPGPQAKGLPDGIGWAAAYDNKLYISDTSGDGLCTREQAAHWVESGVSKYIDNDSGEPAWVTHPDWHSHSWATPDEWRKAINGSGAPEYKAILASMREFEKLGYEARVVFWFDN